MTCLIRSTCINFKHAVKYQLQIGISKFNMDISKEKLAVSDTISIVKDLARVRDSQDLLQASKAMILTLLKKLMPNNAHCSVDVIHFRDLVTGMLGGKKCPVPQCLQESLVDRLKKYESGFLVYDDGELNWVVCPLPPTVTGKKVALSISYSNKLLNAEKLLEELVTLIISYSELLNENERDSLTGLLNRKTFDSNIAKVLLREENLKPFHYLAIFDIDFFKKVNDTYGHVIGDEVLLRFGQLMSETFREDDLLFRFGGEEFVAVFNCQKESDIDIILTRLKEKLAKFEFPQVGKITVSVGYSILSKDIVPATSIEHADQALYFAKENGRNQFCSYELLVSTGKLIIDKSHGDIELF